MDANIFTTIIIQPIFNLLVFVYSIIPGHNFGLAIIIFTIIVRTLMWPLVKKQITQAKAMRELAPEIKKIKQAARGDRQKESTMMMELYREREINPLATLGVLIIQIPIVIGLYSSINRIVKDPHQIIDFSYSFLHHLPWLQTLTHNIANFDDSLFGAVNLTKKALGPSGIYYPALFIVLASAVAQYFVSKQLMPQSSEAKGIRQILAEAGQGKQADTSEMNAATSRMMQYFIPLIVLFVYIGWAVALPLYWLVNSVIAYFQQDRVLKRDVAQAEDKAVVVSQQPQKQPKPAKKPRHARRRRR